MNKVILMGRLTRDPEVRYSQGENATAIARYTLAVDRRFSRNSSDEAVDSAHALAGRFGCTVSVSGGRDLITDGNNDLVVEGGA